MEDENLHNVFSTLCSSIACPAPKVKQIFRIKKLIPDESSPTDAPVIIKLKTPTDKITVLKSAAAFRKNNKCTLSLQQVGINSQASIYLNEGLSKAQQKILATAVRLKKQRKLWAVFTKRSRVHIKRNQNESAIEIKNVDMINDLFRVDSI